MSMPPNEPHFILRLDYDRYSVLVRDAHGNYQTLLSLEKEYNWQVAADMVLDAIVSIDPAILPDPNGNAKP